MTTRKTAYLGQGCKWGGCSIVMLQPEEQHCVIKNELQLRQCQLHSAALCVKFQLYSTYIGLYRDI